MTPLEAALEYAKAGMSVIPAHTPDADGGCSCGKSDCIENRKQGKHSRIAWKEYQSRRATEEEIRRWWTQWPEANVGIVTGKVSDFVGLDSDGEAGRESLKDKHLPLTPTAKTGREEGGEHRYFKHPGFECRNKAGVWPDGNVYPGLDFRGDGGMIIVPPSLHASGKQYQFADGLALGEVDLAPCPDWLLEMLRKAPSKPAERAEGAEGSIIAEGARNDTLFKLAYAMRRQGASEKAIYGAIYFENKDRCNPPLDESELSEIAASAAKYEPAPEESTTTAAIPTVSLSDLLAERMEPAKWLVDRLIPETGLTMLAADSGVGKSWLAYHLALCATGGEPFLGHFSTREATSLIIDLESGRARVQRRMSKLVLPMDAAGWGIDIAFGASLGLDKPENAVRFSDLVKQHKPDLLIIDSLRRVYSGDENESQTAAKVGGFLHSLAEECNCAILLIHHLRKVSAFSSNSGGERVRGSSDWRAVVDSLLVLSKKRPGVLSVEHVKSRDCEELPEFLIEADFGQEDEAPATLRYIGAVGQAEKREGVQQKILDCLVASGGAWRQDVLAMAEEWGVCKETVKRALSDLLESDAIAIVDGPRKTKRYVPKPPSLMEVAEL